MKKALCILGTLAILLTTLTVGGFQVNATSSLQDGGLYYEVENGQATITDHTRVFKGTTVPSTVGGYPVTAIGDAAFYGCITLTTVTIPSSVKTIGRNAFGSCTNMISVSVPSGVTAIEGGTFYGCTKLTTVSLPDSITSIGNQAFYNTAYYDAPANWTGSILYINNHVVDAKSWAAGDQVIRDGTKCIADSSFYGCTDLTSISLPNGLTAIGEKAFYNCNSLKTVTIPDGVTVLRNEAFYLCDALESVDLPDTLTAIGASAFSGCASLRDIAIPRNVAAIEGNAFASCKELYTITVDASNDVYHSRHNCLIETASRTLITGCYNSRIPSDGSVTAIGVGAFSGCSNLTAIVIPDTITRLNSNAFYYCSSLAQISIPDTITVLGSGVFSYATALADVYYGGDQTAWNSFVRGESTTSPLLKARVHYNTLVPHWVLSEVIEPPTCITFGVGEYTCDCGHFIDQPLAPTGHPAFEAVSVVAPTCTTDGYTVYQCTACAYSYHADEIGAAHTFENDVCVWCELPIEQCLSQNELGEHVWTVRQAGMVSLQLTFSGTTALAEGEDSVSIYNGNEQLVGTYTGADLAGQTIDVPGDSAVIHVTIRSEAGASALAISHIAATAPDLGDVNRDAVIDMRDAFVLYRAASGDVTLAEDQQTLADMNNDGECDMRDAFIVYRIASGE